MTPAPVHLRVLSQSAPLGVRALFVSLCKKFPFPCHPPSRLFVLSASLRLGVSLSFSHPCHPRNLWLIMSSRLFVFFASLCPLWLSFLASLRFGVMSFLRPLRFLRSNAFSPSLSRVLSISRLNAFVPFVSFCKRPCAFSASLCPLWLNFLASLRLCVISFLRPLRFLRSNAFSVFLSRLWRISRLNALSLFPSLPSVKIWHFSRLLRPYAANLRPEFRG